MERKIHKPARRGSLSIRVVREAVRKVMEERIRRASSDVLHDKTRSKREMTKAGLALSQRLPR